MITRYANKGISRIFSDTTKVNLWQKMELTVLQAAVNLGKLDQEIYLKIEKLWQENRISIKWWKKRDDEIHHDLNAFLDERYRFLPPELHCYIHKDITSFDTEEAPFALSLKKAVTIVDNCCKELDETLGRTALQYRYTIMNGRTHGQEAGMQSFGARDLTWLKDLRTAKLALDNAVDNLKYSKLSGITGKYGSIDPRLEKETLRILGLEPYYGATQIIPRIIYAPVAQALSNMVSVIDKIATDIRLAARSGRPLMQEPFRKKQKGSSAMPHKKNPIQLEQIEGMANMVRGYAIMMSGTIKTWEERTIEQSCVERVAWPDLFHATVRSLNVLNKVLSGLKVYPDNMLEEVFQSRGVYASSEVKEFLKENLAGSGLSNEDVYRIVQLAAFNVFKPTPERMVIRETIPTSFTKSLELLTRVSNLPPAKVVSLADVIPAAELEINDDLDITQADIDKYNLTLKQLFKKEGIRAEWNQLFTPEFLLRNEKVLYQEILGVE